LDNGYTHNKHELKAIFQHVTFIVYYLLYISMTIQHLVIILLHSTTCI